MREDNKQNDNSPVRFDMKYRERKQVAATYRHEHCTRWGAKQSVL
jgi:hypothetical protein